MYMCMDIYVYGIYIYRNIYMYREIRVFICLFRCIYRYISIFRDICI